MKKIKAIVGLLLLMVGQVVAQTTEYDTDRGFIHPGGLHTQEDFDRVKAQLATVLPPPGCSSTTTSRLILTMTDCCPTRSASTPPCSAALLHAASSMTAIGLCSLATTRAT